MLIKLFLSLLISSNSISMTMAPRVSFRTAYSNDSKDRLSSFYAWPYLLRAWTAKEGTLARFASDAKAAASSAARSEAIRGPLVLSSWHNAYNKGIESRGPGPPSGSAGGVNWSRK